MVIILTVTGGKVRDTDDVMNMPDIDVLPTSSDIQADNKRLRKRAPEYLRSVVEDSRAIPQLSSLAELRSEQIEALGGGVDAATYLVISPKIKCIIKFTYDGFEAEVEALQAWRQRHVRVPEVIASGTVPVTKGDARPVKFLAQQALLEPNRRLAETCASYLVHSPEKARVIGRLLGAELSKLHRAVATRSFGEYADAPGNTAPYASWNHYLEGYFDVQLGFLRSLDIDENRLQKVRHFIRTHRFVPRGRYLHGDFSIRNATVKTHGQLRVYLFDPNPLVGDPTWDLAVPFNNYAFQKRRIRHDDTHRELFVRNQQLLIGLKQGYTRRIDEPSLWVSRLLQACLQAQYAADSDKKDELDVEVRQQLVRELVEKIASRGDAS